MFSRLGAEVHVIARGPLPLAPRFDKEVGGSAFFHRFVLHAYRPEARMACVWVSF
jgi:hypothetical protein